METLAYTTVSVVFIRAPVSSLYACVHVSVKCVQVGYMCWRVWVCVCVDVCRPSSVNIVLCSSNSSSSGSAVAAHSTVYFPSWRTTSYQISRHCLRACCPTTRSRRISRLLSSGLSYRGSAHSQRLTAKQATHISISDNNSICSELMHKSLLKSLHD